jgi:hypothetical protein
MAIKLERLGARTQKLSRSCSGLGAKLKRRNEEEI